MVYRIIWAPRALRDLAEIIGYIKRDDPRIARKFGENLIVKAESLSTFPERGVVVQKYPGKNIRQIALRAYRITYRIQAELAVVEIVRIWHSARNESNLEI